jgi:hypothetical protein
VWKSGLGFKQLWVQNVTCGGGPVGVFTHSTQVSQLEKQELKT